MDCFKSKLKNVLHSAQFCGICLENENKISALDDSLQIVVNQQRYSKTLRELINVVFKDPENIIASSQICNNCTEKLIQSYIFIKNTEDTSKMIEQYVNDLFNKSDDIFNHLSNTSMETLNVVIVLDNKIYSQEDVFIKEGQKNQLKRNKEDNSDVNKEVPKTKEKLSKFKCLDCNIKLPSVRALKLHKVKCNKKVQLNTGGIKKTFRNRHYLNTQYKVPSKVKCNVCNKLINNNDFLDHVMKEHKDSVHKCLKCGELFNSLNTLQIHKSIYHPTEENKHQCVMCLKNFTQDEMRFHDCKFGCPECSVVPCMHYKYLISYKEQKLNNSKAKCLDCDYICRRKEVLLGHVNREHLNHHPYTCDKCGQQFYSKVVLRAHVHTLHNFLICQYCDSEFSVSIYRNHVKSCKDVKRKFLCDNCAASFDTYEKIMNHIKLRHSKDMFPCRLCNKKFLNDSKRKEHFVQVHSGIQHKKKVFNGECVVCQVKYDTKRDLVHHMKTHGPNTVYPCRICNTKYETLRQFRAHNRKHNGPFATCEICGKEMRVILLKKHMTTHGNAIETCETCGRSFQNITLLKYHQKVHLESVPCPKCKKMINPARLRRHLKGHMIEEDPALRRAKKQTPNLKCEQCDYITWNNTLLECHMNRHHLKIKPYVCHICSKDFIGKHLLKKHIETHKIEKSVVCMVCLKSFSNSACLKMHLRLHTGEKPFTCEICGDRFRSSSIMNVHKLKKHSDKSNTCPLCSNKFHTVRELRRHLKKVHWKQKNKRFDPRELKGLSKEHYHLFHDRRRVKVDEEDVDVYMPC